MQDRMEMVVVAEMSCSELRRKYRYSSEVSGKELVSWIVSLMVDWNKT